MWLLYSYLITLVVRSGEVTCVVTVSCASCIGGGLKLEGIVDNDLVIRYVIHSKRFALLEVKHKKSMIDISPTIINKNKIYDKRLSIPQRVSIHGNITIIDVTLKKLSLYDNDVAFSYDYIDMNLNRYTGINRVVVKAPPTFCKPPRKIYPIEVGKRHSIDFSVCGHPKPSTVTAKVGLKTVSVMDVGAGNAPPKYTFKYRLELTMEKEQCGDNLNITAKNFQTKSFHSTMRLLFKPANVKNVTAYRDDDNLLTVTWQKMNQLGSCMVQYNVKRIANGVTEIHGISELVYVFHNADGNNSISVNAEVNGREGEYSSPIFISASKKSTGLKNSAGLSTWIFVIIFVALGVLIIIIFLIILRIIHQRRRLNDPPVGEVIPPIYEEINEDLPTTGNVNIPTSPHEAGLLSVQSYQNVQRHEYSNLEQNEHEYSNVGQHDNETHQDTHEYNDVARQDTHEYNNNVERQDTHEYNNVERQDTYEYNNVERQDTHEYNDVARQDTHEYNNVAQRENERSFSDGVNNSSGSVYEELNDNFEKVLYQLPVLPTQIVHESDTDEDDYVVQEG